MLLFGYLLLILAHKQTNSTWCKLEVARSFRNVVHKYTQKNTLFHINFFHGIPFFRLTNPLAPILSCTYIYIYLSLPAHCNLPFNLNICCCPVSQCNSYACFTHLTRPQSLTNKLRQQRVFGASPCHCSIFVADIFQYNAFLSLFAVILLEIAAACY